MADDKKNGQGIDSARCCPTGRTQLRPGTPLGKIAKAQRAKISEHDAGLHRPCHPMRWCSTRAASSRRTTGGIVFVTKHSSRYRMPTSG